MKKFRSFEILITQTTPDDIWDFFVSKMNVFALRSKHYLSRIEKMLDEIKEYNHYLEFDFYESIERINLYEWSEDCYFDFIREYSVLMKDIELCENVLWCDKEDQENLDAMFEWKRDISNFITNIQFLQNELVYYDNKNIAEVNTKRKEKRLEKDANQKVISNHWNNHKQPENYEEPHVEGEHYYLKFDSSKVYFDKECKLCISEKEFYCSKKIHEDKELFELKQAQLCQQEEEEAKKLAEKKKHESQITNVSTMVCECCEYKTKSKYNFQEHLESKDHQTKYKLKHWFCSDCNTQSRSELEWTYHIKTKKHKIAIGEEEGKPTEYHCESCDYTCRLKTHWTQHIAGKKHQSKLVTPL
jgi:hypothetical protein